MLKECYTAIEFFSPLPSLNFNRKTKISSKSTKICSILALVGYLALISFRIFNWLTDTSFTIKYSLSTQPKTETVTVDKELIDFQISAIDPRAQYLSVDSTEPIKNTDSVDGLTIIGQSVILPGKDGVSLKINKDMKLGGNRAEGHYFDSETGFSFVSPSNQGVTLILNYRSYFINQNKPAEDLKSVDSEQYFSVSSEFDYRIKIYFMKVNLKYALNILFSFGSKVEEDFSFVKDIEIKQVPKKKQGLTTCTMLFEAANDEINYSVEYEQFDSVLAKITAIKDFVLAFGSVLLGLFNQCTYESYIANCCYPPFSNQSEAEINIDSSNNTDLIQNTEKNAIKMSFCDSFRVFCFSKPRNSKAKRMFELMENQFDVVEIIKRNLYIDNFRRNQEEESSKQLNSKDYS